MKLYSAQDVKHNSNRIRVVVNCIKCDIYPGRVVQLIASKSKSARQLSIRQHLLKNNKKQTQKVWTKTILRFWRLYKTPFSLFQRPHIDLPFKLNACQKLFPQTNKRRRRGRFVKSLQVTNFSSFERYFSLEIVLR